MEIKAFDLNNSANLWNDLCKVAVPEPLGGIIESNIPMARLILLTGYPPFLEDWVELENAIEGPELCKHIGKREPRVYAAHMALKVFKGKWGVEVSWGTSWRCKDIALRPINEFASASKIDLDDLREAIHYDPDLLNYFDRKNSVQIEIDLRMTDEQLTHDFLNIVHRARTLTGIDPKKAKSDAFEHAFWKNKIRQRPGRVDKYFSYSPKESDFNILTDRWRGKTFEQIAKSLGKGADNGTKTVKKRFWQIMDLLNFYNLNWDDNARKDYERKFDKARKDEKFAKQFYLGFTKVKSNLTK